MKLHITIYILLSLVTLFTPQPAHANALRNARKVWKEKVIAPVASPIIQALHPSMKWTTLSSEKKTEKLSLAKEKVERTTQQAMLVLGKFEKRPRFQATATLIRLDLEDGMEQVRNARTPEEFEKAVQQLQEIWRSGKNDLRSEM